jgi:hypothetical protein
LVTEVDPPLGYRIKHLDDTTFREKEKTALRIDRRSVLRSLHAFRAIRREPAGTVWPLWLGYPNRRTYAALDFFLSTNPEPNIVNAPIDSPTISAPGAPDRGELALNDDNVTAVGVLTVKHSLPVPGSITLG